MMNPYLIREPGVISLSGGRTSAYMLFKILEAHGGKLPNHLKIVFANTGKEMPETLDFVRDIGTHWDVNIIWVEAEVIRLPYGSKKKYQYKTNIVSYETANRDGKPFAQLIKARRYMPNPVARFCTQELKVLRIRDYMNIFFPKKDKLQTWVNIVGLRADEHRRVVKMRKRDDVLLPLAAAGVTKTHVYYFWKTQNFDLKLANNNGTTDFGNCDLCFLKGQKKKLSIISQRPDLADWWIAQEESLSETIGMGAFFRADQPSYRDLKIIATSHGDLFKLDDDDTIPCYCGD